MTDAETGTQYLDHLLEGRLAQSQLTEQDRALATAIIQGTMRMRARLDAELASLVRKDFDKNKPLVKNILRTALFQVRFLDKVPAYAAVNEAVELARKRFGEPVARFCNGVLRNALRKPYQWPDLQEMVAARDHAQLASYFSYPIWIVNRWIELYGLEQAIALAKAFNRPPPMTIRILRPQQNFDIVNQELHQQGAILTEIAGVCGFYQVEHGHDLASTISFQQGLFTIQDASAGLVTQLASPGSEDRVIDLCAAPGGKTLALAEITAAGVTAVDRSARRLRLLKDAASRLGLPVTTMVADARAVSLPSAELVLVDAPCSGLGVLSRRSDLRWRRQPEDIPELVQLQKTILGNAATLVKTGGALVYSTCTTEPQENDGVVSWFLRQHPAFELIPAEERVDEKYCDRVGFVRTFPHIHGTDGSFSAYLQRRD